MIKFLYLLTILKIAYAKPLKNECVKLLKLGIFTCKWDGK